MSEQRNYKTYKMKQNADQIRVGVMQITRRHVYTKVKSPVHNEYDYLEMKHKLDFLARALQHYIRKFRLNIYKINVEKLRESCDEPYVYMHYTSDSANPKEFGSYICKCASKIGMTDYAFHVYEEKSPFAIVNPNASVNKPISDTSVESDKETPSSMEIVINKEGLKEKYFDLIGTRETNNPQGTLTDYIIREKYLS